MSWLESTLQELKSKKLKVDFLKYLKDKIVDIKNIDFESVEKEVKTELTAFIDSHIAMIESNEIKTPQEVESVFSQEEVKILKLLVKKASNPSKPVSTEEPVKQSKPVPPNKVTRENKQDKIQFALANRHLDGKTVICHTDNGDVSGKVVGLDAPYVIVRTDTGHTAPVLLENITEL